MGKSVSETQSCVSSKEFREWDLYDKQGKRFTLKLDRCFWYLNDERLYTWQQLFKETDYFEEKLLPKLRERDEILENG